MNRSEYWLFETVVELCTPLAFLVHPDIEVMFNKSSHNLNRSELFEAFRVRLDRGEFFAHRESRGNFNPNDAELWAGLIYLPPQERLDMISYGLTAAGGLLWEAMAKPRWDRFIFAEYGDDDGEIIASDEQLATEFLLTLPSNGYDIKSETIVWDTLTPWPATYWKTLPFGRRARFRYERDERFDAGPLTDDYKRLCKWYSSPAWPEGCIHHGEINSGS